MKIKLDENLPTALAEELRKLGEDVADWDGCFVVATERKLRVHRP